MVSMLVSSAVDRGFVPGRVIPKIIKLVFVTSLLSMQHSAVKPKTGWLRMRLACPSGATYLSVDKIQLSVLV